MISIWLTFCGKSVKIVDCTIMKGIEKIMSQEEFIDRLFDIISETKNLPVKDMDSDARKNTITVYLTDGAVFKIRCENCAHINS